MRWLGIDGGGTKTTFSVFDDDMRRLGTFDLGTCHIGQVGSEGLRSVLLEGIAVCEDAGLLGDTWGVGLGLAGYGRQRSMRSAIEGVVAQVVGPRPFTLISDASAARVAALGMADGVVVVAGTGSIAEGCRGGRTARAGGWGCGIGDEGSGWWIGSRLLSAFSRQADGRLPRGPLYKIVREHLSLVDDYDLIRRASEGLADRTRVAGMSLLAFEAAREGDEDAALILRDAVRELVGLARAVGESLFSDALSKGGEVLVSYVGGVFRAEDEILRPFSDLVSEWGRVVAPAFGPDAGACLLLREKIGNG